MAEKIIIIGGGAAGMMAGIAAARAGAHPILLEAGERVGKKILATGNGKCNFTNLNMDEDCFHSSDPRFVGKVIDAFDEDDTLEFFESIGIIPRIRNGYVYPRSEQAASILDALRFELERLKVEVRTGVKVDAIWYEADRPSPFRIQSGDKQIYADRVILAAGGCAAPKTGSDGSGFTLAKALGHHIIPVVPALVQLRVKENFMKSVAGVRTQAKVHIFVNQKLAAEDEGEVQLTDYGISGIPVFQVSRHAAKALRDKQAVFAVIDFLPDLEADEAVQYLKQWKKNRPEAPMAEILTGMVPKKMAELVVKLCREEAVFTKEDHKKRMSGNAAPGIWDVVDKLKNFRLHIVDTNGFDNAQVCAGGVDPSGVYPDSCQSRLVPGLYFAGEILDVDGICGGYNLQWAWSTGMIAGTHAAETTSRDSGNKAGKKSFIKPKGRHR